MHSLYVLFLILMCNVAALTFYATIYEDICCICNKYKEKHVLGTARSAGSGVSLTFDLTGVLLTSQVKVWGGKSTWHLWIDMNLILWLFFLFFMCSSYRYTKVVAALPRLLFSWWHFTLLSYTCYNLIMGCLSLFLLGFTSSFMCENTMASFTTDYQTLARTNRVKRSFITLK